MALSNEKLTQYHLDLRKDYLALLEQHLALKMVTMTMMSMMPLDLRKQIIDLVAPDNTESAGYRQAMNTLVNHLRD